MSRDRDDRSLALRVLLPGFTGTTPPPWLLRAVEHGLGGVALFAPNTPDLQTTQRLTSRLREAGPAIVATDEEGGDVSRLQAMTGSTLPGPAALGAVDDLDLTRRVGAALGRLLTSVGVDLTLAPAMDVASEPRNPVIGVRSFDPDPALVARHGVAMIAGLQSSGAAACAKHYPGHGDTTVDSHLTLPLLEIDEDLLARRELMPFEAALAAGVDAVMTGHLHVPALGPAPASLEPAVTQRLRASPGGEDAVVITDALDMRAVTGPRLAGLGEVCVRALQAGADLLCLGTTNGRDDEAMLTTAVDAVVDALRDGRLASEHLERSAERLARLRARRSTPEDLDPGASLAALSAVGAEAARRATTLVRGDLGTVRGRLGAGPPSLQDRRRPATTASGRLAPGCATALGACHPGAVLVRADADPEGWKRALDVIDGRTAVLALTREPMADEAEAADLQHVLTRRPDAVVVHGGVPAGAPDATTLVLAHGVGLANARAMLELLEGR
ncbi:glycoside hydrolase family 3 protein [Pseudactinotalea sp.]|uniref:glycoside hydrolase family 3 protein n=1 Tax=Pseudactinotalea sp. TaxID=1926260 RepID=UPI003B3B7B74